MMESVIQKVVDGIVVGKARAYARDTRVCGQKGVCRLEIYLADDASQERLLCMAAFPGRRPHYRPWIELFCIKERLSLKAQNGGYCEYLDFCDSAIEDAILRALSESLGPGCKIFIEYYCDRETCCGLAMGIPPVLTRLGYKLFCLGFTWFKDWYFSEGGHEGGQKLQGEKPLDEAARRRHMDRIKSEAELFLQGACDMEAKGDELKYILRAQERANEILIAIQSKP